MTDTTEKGYAFSNAAALVGSGLVAAIGAFLALNTSDPAFGFHMSLFVLGGVLAALAVLKNRNSSLTDANGYCDGPIRVAVIFAIFWGLAGVIVGDVLACQLAYPAMNSDLH